MEYIYRMSKEMYQKVVKDAKECRMTTEEYVTATFGLIGKCASVEIG